MSGGGASSKAAKYQADALRYSADQSNQATNRGLDIQTIS